jgi:hypothetical protein
MYFFWLCLMGSQPYLILLGMTGFLGKDAESAANDISAGCGCLFLLAIVVFAGYSFLQWIGLLT